MNFSSIKNWDWEDRLAKALFVLLIVYAVISLYVLLWGRLGVIPGPGIDVDAMWIYYAIFSFAVVILICVFHLSTTILRENKKRNQ